MQNFKIYESAEARRLPVHVDCQTFGVAFEDVFRALGVPHRYTPEVRLGNGNRCGVSQSHSVGCASGPGVSSGSERCRQGQRVDTKVRVLLGESSRSRNVLAPARARL